MNIVRYSPRRGRTGSLRTASPWNELEAVSNRLSRMIDEAWPSTQNGPGWAPAVNVEETPDELILSAELPGMGHEDVELEIENGVLTISGEKKEEREESEGRRYHLWERTYGSFERSFTLPRTVVADRIEARFSDGVLHVHMPKEEEAKGRKIDIRTEG